MLRLFLLGKGRALTSFLKERAPNNLLIPDKFLRVESSVEISHPQIRHQKSHPPFCRPFFYSILFGLVNQLYLLS